jgi:hypothetical protein
MYTYMIHIHIHNIYIVSQVVVAVEEVRVTLGVLIAAEQSRDSPATPIYRHPPHAASPIDISPASLIYGHPHASPINIEHAARQSDAWRLWRQETLAGGGGGCHARRRRQRPTAAYR